MSERTYRVNEIFYSMQGEGMRAGEMSVFVRLTGCNMSCAMEPGERSPGGFDCDTEFASGVPMTSSEIVARCRELIPTPDGWTPWIVLTGGEPSLQADRALVAQLQESGFRVAMETNGSADVSGLGLDWITCSPKVAEHAVRCLRANEVKYVRGAGQGIPRPACEADHYLISPAFNGLAIDREAMATCIALVRSNPRWRLSVQMHKSWGVR